jgi:hypothetical protein
MASAREQRGLSTVVRVMTIVLAASCPLSGGGPAGRGVASNETDQDRRRKSDHATHLTRHTVTGHPIYVECSTYTSPPQNTYLVYVNPPSDTIRYATCPQDHNQANCPARAVTHL